ncbi:DUF7507 domain-containing protein [Sphaerisporangium corydalis]|uniref:DUF7507 domain-containing protein n=1 Tax=Sphaerisporangium corydalis TaxID=1441875 RepID=A0ABV9EFL3_9ACTN|nr:hypothetical protein [Sphaerisporangium corydalis]
MKTARTPDTANVVGVTEADPAEFTGLVPAARRAATGPVTSAGIPSAGTSSAGIPSAVGSFGCAVAAAGVTGARAPSLALLKTATVVDADGSGTAGAGDSIEWGFAVTNTGTVALTGVTVTDTKAGPVTCPSGALAPAATIACTAAPYVITLADVAGGSVRATATASGTANGGTPVTSAPTSTLTAVFGTQGLSITKTGATIDVNGRRGITAGDRVRWTLKVTNTGTSALTRLTVDDPGDPPVTCPTTILAPGRSVVCTAPDHTITPVDVSTGSVSGTATAAAAGPAGPVTSAQALGRVPLPRPPGPGCHRCDHGDETGDPPLLSSPDAGQRYPEPGEGPTGHVLAAGWAHVPYVPNVPHAPVVPPALPDTGRLDTDFLGPLHDWPANGGDRGDDHLVPTGVPRPPGPGPLPDPGSGPSGGISGGGTGGTGGTSGGPGGGTRGGAGATPSSPGATAPASPGATAPMSPGAAASPPAGVNAGYPDDPGHGDPAVVLAGAAIALGGLAALGAVLARRRLRSRAAGRRSAGG